MNYYILIFDLMAFLLFFRSCGDLKNSPLYSILIVIFIGVIDINLVFVFNTYLLSLDNSFYYWFLLYFLADWLYVYILYFLHSASGVNHSFLSLFLYLTLIIRSLLLIICCILEFNGINSTRFILDFYNIIFTLCFYLLLLWEYKKNV